MNRKQRNSYRKLRVYAGKWMFKPANKQIPLKDWVKRLARVHRHNRPAAVQMFEARFGEIEAPPLFKAIRFLSRINHYRHTGFMFPIFMYQDLPVLQSNTGE